MIPFVPVRKSTFVIGGPQTKDQIDFTDEKRFGKYIVGGLLTNQGADTAVIDGAVTLQTGDSIPIGIHYPYIDKSIYTVVFDAAAGAPDRRLVLMVFKAYPEEATK